jgi:capsid protein
MTRDEITALAKPNRLDKVIATAFPRWALRRVQTRREFAREAAMLSRLRGAAKTISGPEGYSAGNDRIGTMKQVRDLEENFGLFQAIIDKLGLYAFGRLKYQARTGNPAVDQQYEDYIARWSDSCELSGRHDLQQLTCIAFKSELRDGDFGGKWRRDAGMLKLQGIESDRIGGDLIQPLGENYFQGITVDLDTGKPVTYDVYRRTRANAYVDRVAVPASDMLFLFDPRRVDAYRGISPFAPITNEARDLKEVLEACLIGTKFENMHGAVGYTPTGAPLTAPEDLIESSETDANGAAIKEQQLKYGMIQWAPTGAELNFIKSDRPSGTFQTYIDMLIRLQGIALNLPYSFIYSMLGTGPAVRADLQQADRVIQWHRGNVTKRFLNPAKNTALIEGIAAGDIPYTPKWSNGIWQCAPAVSIDAGRDSSAKVAERNAGLRTEDSIFTEDGEDAKEQAAIRMEEANQKLKDARTLAKEHDVDINVALTMLGTQTPNGFLFTAPTGNDTKDGDGDPKNDVAAPREPDDTAKRAEMVALLARKRIELSRTYRN